MSRMREAYAKRYHECLSPLASELEQLLQRELGDMPRVDRISARAKGIDRFLDKANKLENGAPKYTDPLSQIQDQVGARVVAFYIDDVIDVSARVEELFRRIEAKAIVPERDSEFGYFGRHYILLLPTDLPTSSAEDAPTFFELQVKTLFQHAWSEANHDLGYKPEDELDSDFRRKIAFTSAQSWGADQIFNELQRKVIPR